MKSFLDFEKLSCILNLNFLKDIIIELFCEMLFTFKICEESKHKTPLFDFFIEQLRMCLRLLKYVKG